VNLRAANWRTFAIRILLLLSLLFSIYLAVRRAVAAAYFRKGTPSAVQAAIKWDPANPEYYDALGTLTHIYAERGNSDEIVQLYQNATRLSPQDAQFWADLGAAYDWAGRPNDALDAFQRAHRLFPNSPEINWRLANFYVRTGKIPEALRTLRMVLQEDSSAGRRVFTLATNASRDRNALLGMLPPQPPVFFDYLNFLIEKRDIASAKEVWARVLRLDLPFELREAFPYLDALIQHKELGDLSNAWSELAQRFPAQVQRVSPGSNLITNGSFESDILNGGLDWRVLPTEGAIVSLDSAVPFEGARALRIAFDATRNVDYGHVFQYVPVQPKTRYRFSGRMRVQDITTDSGPRFQICDVYNMGHIFVSSENLVGTSGWLEQQAEFTTPADTRLLLLRVVRSVSNKLDNQIAGTVWIDDVRLAPE
jgi:Tetratricopeptide repeat